MEVTERFARLRADPLYESALADVPQRRRGVGPAIATAILLFAGAAGLIAAWLAAPSRISPLAVAPFVLVYAVLAAVILRWTLTRRDAPMVSVPVIVVGVDRLTTRYGGGPWLVQMLRADGSGLVLRTRIEPPPRPGDGGIAHYAADTMFRFRHLG